MTKRGRPRYEHNDYKKNYSVSIKISIHDKVMELIEDKDDTLSGIISNYLEMYITDNQQEK